jgi:hypothetical protein
VSGSRSVSSLAARKPRPHDTHVPHLDRGAPAEPGDRWEAPGPAAPELMGVHGDVDAARATL